MEPCNGYRNTISLTIHIKVPRELSSSAHNRRPLTGRSVNAHAHSAFMALIDHALEKVDVVGGGAGPVLRVEIQTVSSKYPL